jgi:hypothetical protein
MNQEPQEGKNGGDGVSTQDHPKFDVRYLMFEPR